MIIHSTHTFSFRALGNASFALMIGVGVAPLAFAPPLITLPCLITTGFLDKEDVLNEKGPSAFPPVIPVMQKSFVSKLRKIAVVKMRHFSNQCESSCGSFAYGTYLSYVGNAESPVSGGYIASRVFEERYNGLLLGARQKVELGTTPAEIHNVTKVHGILTEAQYSSEAMVNTPLLVEVLNEIGHTYRLELMKDQRNTEEFLQTYREARDVGSDAIQRFFGFYPKKIPTEQAKQQFKRVSGESGFQVVHDYRKFAQIADLMLRAGYPLQIGYDAGGRHSGNGVYESAVRRADIVGSHAAVVVGMLRDERGKLYYQIQNSHRHAPTLYYSEAYMLWYFNDAHFFTPPELAAKIERLL